MKKNTKTLLALAGIVALTGCGSKVISFEKAQEKAIELIESYGEELPKEVKFVEYQEITDDFENDATNSFHSESAITCNYSESKLYCHYYETYLKESTVSPRSSFYSIFIVYDESKGLVVLENYDSDINGYLIRSNEEIQEYAGLDKISFEEERLVMFQEIFEAFTNHEIKYCANGLSYLDTLSTAQDENEFASVVMDASDGDEMSVKFFGNDNADLRVCGSLSGYFESEYITMNYTLEEELVYNFGYEYCETRLYSTDGEKITENQAYTHVTKMINQFKFGCEIEEYNISDYPFVD